MSKAGRRPLPESERRSPTTVFLSPQERAEAKELGVSYAQLFRIGLQVLNELQARSQGEPPHTGGAGKGRCLAHELLRQGLHGARRWQARLDQE